MTIKGREELEGSRVGQIVLVKSLFRLPRRLFSNGNDVKSLIEYELKTQGLN